MGRNISEEVGGAIAAARRARGWSMERLGSESDLHRVTIANIEKGALPNVANIVAIAAALGTTVGALLGEDTSDAAALQRALPGWERLSADQRERIKATVADLAAARPQLSPADERAVEAVIADEQARQARRAGRGGGGGGERRHVAEDDPGEYPGRRAAPGRPV